MSKQFEEYIYVYFTDADSDEPIAIVANSDLSDVQDGAPIARYRLGSIGEVTHKKSTFRVTKPQHMNR